MIRSVMRRSGGDARLEPGQGAADAPAQVLVLPAWRARAISAAWIATSIGVAPPFTPQGVDLALTLGALAGTVLINAWPGLKKRLPRTTLEQARL